MSFTTISASGLGKILESSNSPYIVNSRNEVFPKKRRDYIFEMGKPIPIAVLKKDSLEANMDYVGDISFLQENCKLASYLNTQFQRLKIGHTITAGPRTPEQERRLAGVAREMNIAFDKYRTKRNSDISLYR